LTVNKKILDYIKIKGLSQSEIANKMNIAQSSLNRTLNSDDLKISQLIALCKAIEVSPNYFFDGTETIDNNKISLLENEITSLKSQLHFSNKVFTNEVTSRAHLVQYYNETLDFIFRNPTVLKKISEANIKKIVLSLRENVMCRFEYGYSIDKFCENIIYIINNAKKLPLEGKDYDSLFKAKP
jgi:transcriptional regulator with XRE-family HTH domain